MVTKEQQISRSNANKDAWIRINPRLSVLLDEQTVMHALSFSTINKALNYISENVVLNNQEVV